MNKIRYTTILYIICVAYTLVGCNPQVDKAFMPNCTGKSGEVLVVIQNNKWKSMVGDTIFNFLTQPYPMLPQIESFFDLVHIPHNAFSNIFETHRNIIFVDISETEKSNAILVSRDKWSVPQLIFRLTATSDSSFCKLWNLNKQMILDTIYAEEISRYKNVYRKYHDKGIIEKLRETYNLELNFPAGYNLDVIKPDFAWISYETPRTSQGVFIYQYNYSDTSNFRTENLIAKRDSFLKLNVPGPAKNSYMTTEKRILTSKKEYLMNGNYTCELRGLWRVEGDFLGGPWISISTVDQKRNKLITIDAYVYAGKQDKRNYLWQVESVIKSLKIL